MTPEGNRAVLQAALPEAILTPYCADPPALPHADGYVVGCGLGTSASACRVLEAVLQEAEASAPVPCPAVLDADALNLLAAHPQLWDAPMLRNPNRVVVLTPHPAEMARLTGLSVSAVLADLPGIAADFARLHGVTVVLKDAHTVIAGPDGAIWLSVAGNAGMARGGSGDLLAGGIGTRGPGESKLEMNRRHIRERMTELRRRLDAVEKQRELRRKSREKNEIPVVALVGYTNAGKSTLLNQMTGSNVYVQDQLFATLDAVSRIETAEHTPFLLVDTVGFIRKLPHALVSAFRSTLEEAVLADVLVIVNDGASEEIMQQHDTVQQVLSDLGATEQPRIEVINKCDLYTDEAGAPMLIPGAVRLSAKTGEGIAELHARIAEQLQKTYAPVTFVLPFDRFGLVGQIRPLGRVINEEYTDTGLELTVVLANADRDRLVSKYGKEILKG